MAPLFESDVALAEPLAEEALAADGVLVACLAADLDCLAAFFSGLTKFAQAT